MIGWLRRSRIVRWFLLAAVVAIAAGGVFVWRKTGQLVEPAPRQVGAPPNDFLCDDVSIESDSGARLAGWHRRRDEGRGVVVLLHGIRSNRRSLLPRARLIDEAGFSTLMVDLRCHGESSAGDFITLGHLERLDVRAAVEFAKREHPDEPVAVVGFSLGGAAATLASPLEIDALVLEAVYPTIDKAVENRTQRFGALGPVASWCLLVQLEPRTGVRLADLRPVDHVKECGCPVLIVGGGKDKHTTPDDTRRLHAAAAEPKELVWFDEWAHNNYAHWAPERYRGTVVAFLERQMNRVDVDAQMPEGRELSSPKTEPPGDR